MNSFKILGVKFTRDKLKNFYPGGKLFALANNNSPFQKLKCKILDIVYISYIWDLDELGIICSLNGKHESLLLRNEIVIISRSVNELEKLSLLL